MFFAGIAEEFYNSACPNHALNGYEKNVLMNTSSNKCIFVSGDVLPGDDELLFRCKRIHGNTVVTLKTPYKDKNRETVQDVDGTSLFRRHEGIVRRTKVYEDTYANLVYLPELIANQYILTVKVANLDKFLEVAAGRREGHLDAYEVLKKLEYLVVYESSGMPYESYTVSDEQYDDDGNILDCIDSYSVHKFIFSHYEEMKKGVCAVFSYQDTKAEYPDRERDF